MKLFLTGGEVPDIVPASDLLADYRNCNVAADRGYDSIDLEEQLKAQGCTVVIPSRKTNKVQRDLDWHLYKERHLVEVFFNKIKQCRRIATRYDKLARNYLAWVLIASCFLWIK